ncbi:MAG: hypothetical protein L0219_02550 [Phycisphaerales bacterium]|nr:hypothetical protein [Phycisphaerales bacterium]MCI0674266.1 hypothetical protein [Phycisphaerales bacterium]
MQTSTHSAPGAPPASPRHPDDTAMLLSFVRDRDAHCPRCDYNLRNLTQPVCPECREELVLKVGVRKLRLHWLLLSLAPCAFCAIAMGIFVVMSVVHGPPRGLPIEGVLCLLFMTASGIGGAILASKLHAFLKLPEELQIGWAVGLWLVHLIIFAIVVYNA